jgi:hypothetical protein
VYVHDPGALQMGAKVEGVFNKMLAIPAEAGGLHDIRTERAETIFDDLHSGRRAERNLSALRDKWNMTRVSRVT